MKQVNTVKWIVVFITVVLIATAAACQDSVTLKVIYSKKVKDTVYYIFKMPTGEKVKSFCVCKEEKKRGAKVRVAVKDLEFIKPTF